MSFVAIFSLRIAFEDDEFYRNEYIGIVTEFSAFIGLVEITLSTMLFGD